MQTEGLGEHCIPERGLGRNPSRNRIVCILALNLTSGGIKFTNFSENQLITVSRLRLNLGAPCHDLEGPVPPLHWPQRISATALQALPPAAP